MAGRIRGRVWTFGEGISTDHIISVKYLDSTEPRDWAPHAMEVVDPDFPEKVEKGDIIVAGGNFGCGSSREQAPLALQALGIQAVVAESFARIFFRNSINIGLPAVECPGIAEAVSEGDIVEVDLESGAVSTPAGKLPIAAYPPRVLAILQAGGLIPMLREELRARGGA